MTYDELIEWAKTWDAQYIPKNIEIGVSDALPLEDKVG